jgi:type IV pilus assembly protein PilX
MVLITTLLLLVVVTMLALAMFRGAGLEGRIAGNVMDKQRAVQVANSAQSYAEQWLLNNAATETVAVCSGSTFTSATTPVICSNTLALSSDALSAATVPWTVSGSAVGFSYGPTIPYLSGSSVQTEALPVSTSGGVNQYYQDPVTYIAQLGPDATVPNAVDYQVDAWTYAGAQSTVAVVESTYQIRFTAQNSGP